MLLYIMIVLLILTLLSSCVIENNPIVIDEYGNQVSISDIEKCPIEEFVYIDGIEFRRCY